MPSCDFVPATRTGVAAGLTMSSLPNRSLTDAVKRSAAFLLVSLAALSRPAGAGPAERLWQFLTTHPESGVFGYPGEVALRKYVFREFRRLGLKEVHGLPFETGTPFQHYARLQVAGEVNTQDPKSETSNPTSQIRDPPPVLLAQPGADLLHTAGGHQGQAALRGRRAVPTVRRPGGPGAHRAAGLGLRRPLVECL